MDNVGNFLGVINGQDLIVNKDHVGVCLALLFLLGLIRTRGQVGNGDVGSMEQQRSSCRRLWLLFGCC